MRFLVTAGPTREPIDDVRFLSNRSTGRMGYAVAEAAARAGHEVVLVSGPVALDPPSGVAVVPVETALEMRAAVLPRLPETDALVMAAAVADYRPEARIAGKRKKGGDGETWNLALVRNPDILADAAASKGERIHVGFAVESADLVVNASRKLAAKSLDLIVANDVSAFGAARSTVVLLAPGQEPERLEGLPKTETADRIVAFCEARFRAIRSSGSGTSGRGSGTGTP